MLGPEGGAADQQLRVIETLADAMLAKGVPEHVRCDNGPEMVARALREWLAQLGTKTLYIEPGSPGENGYCESFNGKLRDECLKLGCRRELCRNSGGAISGMKMVFGQAARSIVSFVSDACGSVFQPSTLRMVI